MQKVAFKCIASGNLVYFTDEADIESMRKEPHYQEVKQEPEQILAQDIAPPKKRGRPVTKQ